MRDEILFISQTRKNKMEKDDFHPLKHIPASFTIYFIML